MARRSRRTQGKAQGKTQRQTQDSRLGPRSPLAGAASSGGPVIGIDIGGSGIKAARVDVSSGTLVGNRRKLATPRPSTPAAVADAAAELLGKLGGDGPVGIAVPGVVTGGIVHTAPNLDRSWLGTDARALFASRLGRPAAEIEVLNDADAAGRAEVHFGHEDASTGCVLMLTFGTGIGSALFIDGTLVPNTELGHIEVDGGIGERRASAAVREREGLSYPQWTQRVNRYLAAVEQMMWPDLIVLGGGVSRKAGAWLPGLHTRTPLRVASLFNAAGIVGAASAAARSPAPGLARPQ